MSDKTKNDVLEYLQENNWKIRGILLAEGHADNCITTGQVMVNVFDHFGFYSFPVTARIVVASDYWYTVYKEDYGRDMPTMIKGLGDKMRTIHETKEVLFCVGYHDPDNPPAYMEGWPGHLVNIVRNGGKWHLVDFSVDQADEYFRRRGDMPNVTFPPFVMLTDLTGDVYPKERRIEFLKHGLNIEYRLFPNDLSNRMTPLGRDRSFEAYAEKLANRIIEHMERNL